MATTTAKKGKKPDTSKKRRIWALIVTAILIVGSLAIAFPPQDKINQGLDIKGGLSVVLAAKADDGQQITQEDMEKAKSIIESRVNALGASEATVQVQGADQILVQIPGLSDSSAALATIGKTGVLEFARLDSFTDDEVKDNIDSGNIIDYGSADTPSGDAPTGALQGLVDLSDAKHITVESGTYEPLFTGDHITQVTIGKESDTSQYYSVNLRLDQQASKAFADASTDLLPTNGKIVILLDGEVNSAPAIQSAITTGEVSITGNYTIEDARALQTVLDSGSLPVSFTYEQSQTVGPTLGQGELAAGLLAMLIGIIVVMVYLIVFYRGFGLIPAANMVVFTIVYLGVLGALSAAGLFSLSLAGIAGIILSIGMTADSVILAIEKVKEEIKEGRSVKSAAQSGVKHALITSVDADVVSLITAIALFAFATSSIKGFGLTLALGIICDILVMFVFVTPLIRLLAPSAMRYHPEFWGIKYALELGDVRTGSHNYLDPDEAREMREEKRERERERKERERNCQSSLRDRNKASEKTAREIRKQSKKDEKLAKKKKLEEIKAEDAERDRLRKEAKRQARKSAKAAKGNLDEIESELEDALVASDKAGDEMDRAERAEDKAIERGDEDAVEREEEKFEDALDEQAKADDDVARLVGKLKEAKARETEAEEALVAAEVGEVLEDGADSADSEESDGNPAIDVEVADDHEGIEARTSAEIADIIASTSGLGAIVVEEAEEEARSGEPEEASGGEKDNASEDEREGASTDAAASADEPAPKRINDTKHKNRAQRRKGKRR